MKLMGRHAGFIAAGASVVSQEVNFTLVPEIPFPLEGEDGFLSALHVALFSILVFPKTFRTNDNDFGNMLTFELANKS